MASAKENACGASTDPVIVEFEPILVNDAPATTSGNGVGSKLNVNAASSFKAHKVLYPTPSHLFPSKWSGLTAFDMVQQISMMALNSSKMKQPLHGSSETLQSSYSFLQFLADDNVTANDAGLGAGQKRKRDSFDDDYEEDISGCELVASVLDDQSSIADVAADLTPWKPSKLIARCTQAAQSKDLERTSEQLNHLDSIVANFEQLAIEPKNRHFIPSYNRIQMLFSSNMSSLSPDGSMHLVLDRAIEQMQALMEMAHPIASTTHVPRVRFTEFVAFHDGSRQPMSKPNPLRIMNGIVLTQTPLSDKAKKQVFNAYMTEWLCQCRNWINPYPDETVLNQMASHFIHIDCVPGTDSNVTEAEAVAKINTWLVNTRTRQWRPSVEEAFDAQRPAMLLMEDSLRIFKGDELRPLIGWDSSHLFARLGDYSKPIATWGKKASPKSVPLPSEAPSEDHSSDDFDFTVDIMANGTTHLFPQAQGALADTLEELFDCAIDQDFMFMEEV
jgi:hypothetical protein